MQALEKIGVLEQDEEKGGRRITQSGQRDLDRECSFSPFKPSLSEMGLTFAFYSGIAQTTIEESDEEDED